jgi:hypothetical protein
VSWWIDCTDGADFGSAWQCPQTSNSETGFAVHTIQASPQGVYGGFSTQDVLIRVGTCTITPRRCGDPRVTGCIKGDDYVLECWDRSNPPFCNQ